MKKLIELQEINPITKDGFELYPKINTIRLTEELLFHSNCQACEAAITIFDISGRVVKRFQDIMVLEPMM
ncbi:MAG: hypothetical protein R2784_06945 [Saprospiraceae bacterium]